MKSAWLLCGATTPTSVASWMWPARSLCTLLAIGPTSGRRLEWKGPYLFIQVSIYGIWFYDKEECQRIAKLMKHLTQCEQLKACHGAGAGSSPVTLNSGESQEVDILQMLTKAKDEYTKTLDPKPQHLSLTALFGKQDKAPCQETMKTSQTFAHHHHHHHYHQQQQQQQQQQQEKLPVHHGFACSLSCEEPRKLLLPVEKQLCPAIQKLMVGSTGLHPLPRHPEQWPCESGSPSPARGILPGPVQLGSPWNGGTAYCAQSTGRSHKLLEQLQGAPGAVHKYNPCAPASPAVATQVAPGQSMAQSQLMYFSGPLPPLIPGHQTLRKEQCAPPVQALPLPGSQESSSRMLPTQELLRKLQVVQQEQQAAPRPALAARFPVSAQGSGTEKPLEAWVSKTASMENQAPLLQSTCAPLRETDNGLMPLGGQELPAASSSLLLPPQNWDSSTMASRPLSRLQLQEALLNLIQNDDSFLSIIYEAYLFSVTQAAMRKAT
ncbi:mRNA-decapping enzyme 1B isoform X2 [Acomys russatus]|uniref:mRNA-decapping enzyme 1B isoform X2 n=1 Tax=Acomys russatus TaxID=60746 RepID=UPI0021E2F3D4|nr:mRNA-decapping enzyme 1B isoform X2 [Acomys russatus]